MKYVIVDTDILIDFTKGETDSLLTLNRLGKNNELLISVMTKFEILVGARNKGEFKELESFINTYQIVDFTASITSEAISLLRKYRLSHGLLVADSLIASTALILNCPLITKNQKDFKFISGLDLLKYPLLK